MKTHEWVIAENGFRLHPSHKAFGTFFPENLVRFYDRFPNTFFRQLNSPTNLSSDEEIYENFFFRILYNKFFREKIPAFFFQKSFSVKKSQFFRKSFWTWKFCIFFYRSTSECLARYNTDACTPLVILLQLLLVHVHVVEEECIHGYYVRLQNGHH